LEQKSIKSINQSFRKYLHVKRWTTMSFDYHDVKTCTEEWLLP